jgi:predicted HicB family RNase H-like nuclease
MTRPSKRRGRPTLDPEGLPSVHLTVRLPTKHFDALCARADAARESLPQYVRRTLHANSVTRK